MRRAAEAHLTSRSQPPPLRGQDKIEAAYSFRFYLPHLDQQVGPEQRIFVVAFLPRKVQLCGQDRAIGRLNPNVVVPGSSRIQARQNRFQCVPSTGIRKLMSPATETVQIVFTSTI